MYRTSFVAFILFALIKGGSRTTGYESSSQKFERCLKWDGREVSGTKLNNLLQVRGMDDIDNNNNGRI